MVPRRSANAERDNQPMAAYIAGRDPSNIIQETALTQIAITKTTSPKQPPADETLTFGRGLLRPHVPDGLPRGSGLA